MHAHLVTVTETITQKLSYFSEFDHISHILNTPGETLVKEPGFITMLQKLDSCLEFVSSNPSYKDSGLFKMRYRQCLTLIKMYFVDALRKLVGEIKDTLSQRSTNEPLPPNLQLSLFYSKFVTFASKTKHLVIEIEKRCAGHPEYYYLLKDCLNAFTNVRKSLLSPYISDTIKQMQDPNLMTFATNGCAYLLRVCGDEYQLFREIFTLGEDSIRSYIDSISQLLSQQLRPLILKEVRIDILSDLCNSLLLYLEPNTYEDGKKNNESVRYVVEAILEGAQSRLSFRAQEFILSEIRQFKPREQEILLLARGPGLPKPAAVNPITSVSELLPITAENTPISPSLSSAFESEPPVIQEVDKSFGGGEWYPTLQRTMNLLAKLHGAIPEASFDDLAQDAVESCRLTIIEASDMLANKESPADAHLFIIKNMLQLREHVSYYDAKFTRFKSAFKFVDVLDAIKDVFAQPLRFQSYGNLALPFIKTQNDDVRQLLDSDLRKACENFILGISQIVCQPLIVFLGQCQPYKKPDSLANQPFASPDAVQSVHDSFVKSLQANLLPQILLLKNYLGDKNTQLTLIRIAKNSIVGSFIDFIAVVKQLHLIIPVKNEVEISDIIDQILEFGMH
ncbi:Golgi transport complex subunit 3 [Boothiomyces macroporosus]|uniref:Conserved oligomeric Golgi complex subunit 3 n=1 Tax=Boothiomyces macroporosus TaxID=261099 RepID=A0AAD5UGA5_9FUNG|nr:Golgi transport complex subunit 3 [Boothiomyces macroporosus]